MSVCDADFKRSIVAVTFQIEFIDHAVRFSHHGNLILAIGLQRLLPKREQREF
jgi:hypothetical protein